jgi:hypothetical protein
MRAIVVSALAVVLLLGSSAAAVVAAPADALSSKPSTIDFHRKRVGTENYKRTRISNASGVPINLIVSAGLPDDFGFGLLPGSTCPVLAPATLAPGDSCYAVVRFSPSEFFIGWPAEGSLTATATDPATGAVVAELVVPVSGMAAP